MRASVGTKSPSWFPVCLATVIAVSQCFTGCRGKKLNYLCLSAFDRSSLSSLLTHSLWDACTQHAYTRVASNLGGLPKAVIVTGGEALGGSSPGWGLCPVHPICESLQLWLVSAFFHPLLKVEWCCLSQAVLVVENMSRSCEGL